MYMAWPYDLANEHNKNNIRLTRTYGTDRCNAHVQLKIFK